MPTTIAYRRPTAGTQPDYLFPRYVAEGKAHLTVGIGCTGGRHRSVTISAWLAEHFAAKGFQATVRHRDMLRD